MPTDAVMIAGANGPIELPVYDPETVAWPVLRTVDPADPSRVVAFAAVPNPPLEPHYQVRFSDGSTVYAIDTRTARVIDGFEDGAWPGEWTGETSYYSLTTDALAGTYSLVLDGADKEVAIPTVTTTRDRTYSMRTVTSGDGWAFLIAHGQAAASPLSNCYTARISPTDNLLEVVVRDGNVDATKQAATVTLSAGTEYQLALDIATDGVQARVFDATGTQLGATGWLADTRYDTGYLGLYCADATGTGSRFDAFTEHPLGVAE